MIEQSGQNWKYSNTPKDVLIYRASISGEESVYPQPKITPELAQEREQISEMCFNGARISPESLIRRAIEPPIDFIDLYAYHEAMLNPRAEEFQKANPLAKVIHVGLEFESSGQKEGFPDKKRIVHFNKFLVNYDALPFLKRLQPNSVGFINIDFPDLREKKILLLEEAKRVLKKDGQISFYVDIGLEKDTERLLKDLGFSVSPTNRMVADGFLERRPYHSGQIVRVLATK